MVYCLLYNGPGGLMHVPRTGTRFSLETHSYRSHRQQRSVANERQMRRPQELHEHGYGTRSIRRHHNMRIFGIRPAEHVP